MKLTIDKEKLAEALAAVSGVVKGKTTLPILNNVLLRVNGAALELVATDLDVTASCHVPARIERDGAVTVPVAKLANIAACVDGEVSIEADERHYVAMRCESASYEVFGIKAEDFPAISGINEQNRVTLSQASLKDALCKAAWSQSDNISRHLMNGVCFQFDGSTLTIVATSGHCLACTELQLETRTATREFILPTKAVTQLAAMLDTAAECVIAWSENQAQFACGERVLKAKLIEGKFPNWRQVIPKEESQRISMNRAELLAALKRAQIMTNEKNPFVKLVIGKNKITFESSSAEVGKARITLAVNYKGPDETVCVNPSYLIDALSATDDDDIWFDFIDKLSPVQIKTAGKYFALMMVVRQS